MIRDVPAKLRLTAAALGCRTRKELGAHFRAVNPTTHFDLDRAHKWLQGRSLPRSMAVFDDWSRVLGIGRPGAWVAACALDEFRAALGTAFALDPAVLDDEDVDAAAAGPLAYLMGWFACYSWAWSPHFEGQLIRGTLRLEPQRRDRLLARYTETLPGRPAIFSGEVTSAGRALHMALREPETELPVFLSFALPGPPAGALCGVMSGATLIDPEARPSASRMVAVRVPSAPNGTTCYLPASASIATDLASAGVVVSDEGAVDSLVRRILNRNQAIGLIQASAADQAALSRLFDGPLLRHADTARGIVREQ